MNTEQQVPKLDAFSIAFICLLTISAIVAPVVIVNFNRSKIETYIQEAKDKIPQMQTFSASNFTVFGKAVNDDKWVANIERNSGFSFSVHSDKLATAKIAIKYKSENLGAILKVNGNAQNLYFPSTKGNWSGGQGYNQQPHKTVIVKLQQGENNIELSSGWLTDFAPDIAEITVTIDNDIQKPYMAGVWKGNYGKGKGRTTLTINDDMTGVSEFVWQGTKGSHSVRVNSSNGKISISGVEWIDKPQRGWWSFDNWTGTIVNGKFSGSDFNLEKLGTAVLLSVSQNWRYSLSTPTDNWYSTSFNDYQWEQGYAPFGNEQNLQKTRWTTSQIFIRTTFSISDVSSIGYAYLNVWHDEDVQIYLNGQLALNRSRHISNYDFFEFNKSFLKSGENVIAAKCTQNTGGQLIDVGVFVNTEKQIVSSYEKPSSVNNEDFSSNNNNADIDNNKNSSVDYSAKEETTSNLGRFPEASERLLSTSDLSGLSKYDLKIMRNEIFARHGYIFTTSDMKNYFKNQSWYTPQYSNVTSMLTSIEQKNIVLIKRYE